MRPQMGFSKFNVTVLVIWYAGVFFFGGFLVFDVLAKEKIIYSNSIDLTYALESAIGASLLTSSLFYIRKLYKEMFAYKVEEGAEFKPFIELATLVYFLSRPLFAALFASIVVVVSAAFVHAVTAHDARLSVGFIFFTTLLSAYGAAITGQVVRHLETLATERLRTFGGS